MYIDSKATTTLLFIAGYLFDFSSAVEKRSKSNGQYIAIRPRGRREAQLDLGKGPKNYYLCRDVPIGKFSTNNGDVFAEEEESKIVTLTLEANGQYPEIDSTIGCRWWPKVVQNVIQGEEQLFEVSGLPRRERSKKEPYPLEYLGHIKNARTPLGPYSVISAPADIDGNSGSKIVFERRPGIDSPKERFMERAPGEPYVIQTHTEPIKLTSGITTHQPGKICRNTYFPGYSITHPWKLYLNDLPPHLIKKESLDCKDVDLWLLPLSTATFGTTLRQLAYSVPDSNSLTPVFSFDFKAPVRDGRKKAQERKNIVKVHEKFKEAMENEALEGIENGNDAGSMRNEHVADKDTPFQSSVKEGIRRFKFTDDVDDELEPPLFKSKRIGQNEEEKIPQDPSPLIPVSGSGDNADSDPFADLF